MLKKIGDKGWAALDVVGRQVCDRCYYINNTSLINCCLSADQSNKIANKLGAEAFWPMSLDKECEKASAIVRTFTLDGFQVRSKDRNGNNTKSLVKIPPKVLQNAKGLAIFTVFRTGFSLSGAGGSGILIARQIDGCELLVSSFPPPLIILMHSLGSTFRHSPTHTRHRLSNRYRHLRYGPCPPHAGSRQRLRPPQDLNWRRTLRRRRPYRLRRGSRHGIQR